VESFKMGKCLKQCNTIRGTNILEVANIGITDEQRSGSGRTNDMRFKNGHESKYNLGSGQPATLYTAKAM